MMLAKMPSAEIRLRKSGGGVFERQTSLFKEGDRPISDRRGSARRRRLMNRPSPSIQWERVACRVAAAIKHRPRIR
jgi:hypothetical protein